MLEAELDLLVIQGTVVSAEHVSKTGEPLNLKKFIREFDLPVIVGGCVVLVSVLRALGYDEVLVSESDILDGIVRRLAVG